MRPIVCSCTIALMVTMALCCLSLSAADQSLPVPNESSEMSETSKQHDAFLEEFKQSHPPRLAQRSDSPLSHDMIDQANLFFRSLDTDHDKHITTEDVAQAAQRLAKHVPGVTVAEFSAFLELADRNGDKKVNHNEFLHALTKGMRAIPALVETGEKAERGFFGSVGENLKAKASGLFNKLTGQIDTSNDGCVLCQYIVERCETNVKQSGVIPALTGAQTGGANIFLEMEQSPLDLVASKVIGNTRISTRYQRQLERQKFNEIYRVVDITLDDVCEQGMPNSFYQYCKAVYQKQSDVVDGLRYQYRPSDICYRIGLCGKKSYITKGVHSRYKKKK